MSQEIVVSKNGLYAVVRTAPLVSSTGLRYVTQQTDLSDKEKKSLAVLSSILKNSTPQKLYRPAKKNDYLKQYQERNRNRYHKKSDQDVKYYNLDGKGYSCLCPSSFGKIFSVAYCTSTELEEGFQIAVALQPVLDDLKKLFKRHDVYFNSTDLNKMFALNNDVKTGVVHIGSPSDANFGETSSYAVFVEGGYLDSQKYPAPLSNARLFPSEKLASNFAKSEDEYSIVKLSIAADCIVKETQSFDELNNAMCVLQKERMQKEIEKMEIEQLRARLSELENKYNEKPMEKVKRKRKM